jgi:hypothetical protein
MYVKEAGLARPRLRWTFLFAGVAQGVNFLVDAFQIFRSTTLDAVVSRPWVRLVERLGLDPLSFGPVCLIFGVAWLSVTIAILRGSQRAFQPAKILAIASLWYVIVGTGFAVIYLIALMTLQDRAEEE